MKEIGLTTNATEKAHSLILTVATTKENIKTTPRAVKEWKNEVAAPTIGAPSSKVIERAKECSAGETDQFIKESSF